MANLGIVVNGIKVSRSGGYGYGYGYGYVTGMVMVTGRMARIKRRKNNDHGLV